MTNRSTKRIAATSLALAAISLHKSDAVVTPSSSSRVSATKINVIGEQASSIGPAQVLRDLKERLPQIEWLAEGDGSPRNKVDILEHVAHLLAHPDAPKRVAENEERTERIQSRARQASKDAMKL